MSSPAPGIQSKDYAIRWKNSIYFPAGIRTISFTSDDGVRIWIDNRIFLDKWYDHGRQKFTKIFNSAGVAYEIRVEYYNNERHGVAILELE